MRRAIDVRVAVAGGDQAWRERVSAALNGADCRVVVCPDALSLECALEVHDRADRSFDALVVDASLVTGGVPMLRSLGFFEWGAPVIIVLERSDPALAASAYAAGAVLVVERAGEPSELVRAVRHLVHRERRWSGEWISTRKLVRPPKSDEDEPT